MKHRVISFNAQFLSLNKPIIILMYLKLNKFLLDNMTFTEGSKCFENKFAFAINAKCL